MNSKVSKADFTVLFRLLANQPSKFSHLLPAFEIVTPELEHAWSSWLERLAALVAVEGRDSEVRKAEMLSASPKYVPRNWMLFEAYEAADRGDYTPVRGMLSMLSKPYEEQPEFEDAYFRLAPSWARTGGLAFMS